MTAHQTIQVLVRQLQDANATISRQAETIAQLQAALCHLAAELRQARTTPPPPTAFPMRALRYGSPASA